eukprot:scaffold33_cov147-Skeletonema_menzelii.AAC.10
MMSSIESFGRLTVSSTTTTAPTDDVATTEIGRRRKGLQSTVKLAQGLQGKISVWTHSRAILSTSYIPRAGYSVELKEYMDGVKRIANEARAAGEGNIHDGTRALPWPLYLDMNGWLIEEDTDMYRA